MNSMQLKMAEQLARQLHESLPQQQQQQQQLSQQQQMIPNPKPIPSEQQSIRKSNEDQWIK